MSESGFSGLEDFQDFVIILLIVLPFGSTVDVRSRNAFS